MQVHTSMAMRRLYTLRAEGEMLMEHPCLKGDVRIAKVLFCSQVPDAWPLICMEPRGRSYRVENIFDRVETRSSTV